MPVIHQKFDSFKIDKIKRFLEDMATKGQARPYEIFVDSLKVVPKTEDVAEFDSYEQYIDEDTAKLRILVYNSGLSPRNDQYCFMIGSDRPEKSFGGLGEIDTIVAERLAARDREYELQDLRKQLQEARAQVEEAESEADSVRQELEAVKAGQQRKQIKGIEVVSIILEGFVRRNPQLLQRIPGGEALAGLIEQDNADSSVASPAEPVTEASFRKRSEPGAGLTPEQLRYIDTLRRLEATFQQPELETVMQVLARFAEAPETLSTVAELLTIKNPQP
ncbi:hypothetical protein [Puia dinghuensis]|uniref:Uncharacterized protein n=1 Tax=Puia dinghuensis TaxID=1792502 RepID=A0A8J2XRQ4_9BACT|nr:hypothetical protein [Puia dinghuensis]GGA89951.1 hypothetical protein GCM10011511_11500 [Puia dinghuensis]